MKYYLAVDMGTTNWKAAVFQENGKLAAIERTPTITHRDAAGRSFYDPSEIWAAVCSLCKKVTARTGHPIAAVSVTSVAEAVVAVDQKGEPVGEIITWFDTRSMQQAQELEKNFGKEDLYRITGLDVNPIFSLPKILWVRKNRPDIYEKACKWLQIADYILFRMSGEYVTDYTLASRTLAFDICKNQWSKEILERAEVSVETFPRVEESGTVVGKVNGKISELTGITRGAKVVVGGNDHPCGSLAAGVIGANKILDSSGTAESFICVSARGLVPGMTFRGQRTCRYLRKDQYALWGGIICSGRTFDWAREIFGEEDCFASVDGMNETGQESGRDQKMREMLRQIEQVRGIESGLIFYPHLRGAGAPYWNPKGKGAFLGLTDQHTARNMLRSVLEGLCMQARMIVEMEEDIAARKADSVSVIGGSSRNLLWQKIKADILGKDVEICPEAEATALGAAMLAAIGDGVYSDLDEVSKLLAQKNQVIHPNSSRTKIYDEWYQIYREGYEKILSLNERTDGLIRR